MQYKLLHAIIYLGEIFTPRFLGKRKKQTMDNIFELRENGDGTYILWKVIDKSIGRTIKTNQLSNLSHNNKLFSF